MNWHDSDDGIERTGVHPRHVTWHSSLRIGALAVQALDGLIPIISMKIFFRSQTASRTQNQVALPACVRISTRQYAAQLTAPGPLFHPLYPMLDRRRCGGMRCHGGGGFWRPGSSSANDGR
jgi:hypothetical protein